MATPGPVAAALLPGPGGAGKGRGAPCGPAAGHVPRVEPADDLVRALHRASGEWCPPVADHADLHADPPLVVNAGQTVPGRGRDRLLRGPARRGHRPPARAVGPADALRPVRPMGGTAARRPVRILGPARPIRAAVGVWSGPRVQPRVPLASSPAPAPARGAAPSHPAASSRCLRPRPGPPPPSRAPRAGPPPSRIRCPSPAVSPQVPVPTPVPLISAPSAGRRSSRAPARPGPRE